MKNILDTDICIIGAGSAGLSIAAGAAQLGRDVVLIEKGKMGGDCLNYGCVPSKALITAANSYHAAKSAARFGAPQFSTPADYGAVMKHVYEAIAAIEPNDSQARFEGLGVTVLREHAAFTGPRQVKAGDTVINAKHFVLATGSSPAIPPIEGLLETPHLTNETLFAARPLPAHLVVIGGGPIGVELAQAHRRLGCEVTIIEGEKILAKDDPELVGVVRKQLETDGVNIIEHTFVNRVAADGAGIEVQAGNQKIKGSEILVAAGRTANVEGLNLDAAGIEYSRRGVTVDARLRTTNKRVFAAGDVTGGLQFTHVAGYHASIIVRNMLFKTPSKNRDSQSPWVTYCDPELAQVGLTEAAAREMNSDTKIVRWDFHENDRAIAEGDTRGFVKVVTNSSGKILGASIVGKNAGDLIQPFALALSNKMKIKAFTNYIAPYPTRGEAAKRAAGAWYTPTLFSDRTRKLVSLLSIFD